MKRRLSVALGKRPLRTYEAAGCGSVAGGVAAAFTTPLDVLKTRVMLDMRVRLSQAVLHFYAPLTMKTPYRTPNLRKCHHLLRDSQASTGVKALAHCLRALCRGHCGSQPEEPCSLARMNGPSPPSWISTRRCHFLLSLIV